MKSSISKNYVDSLFDFIRRRGNVTFFELFHDFNDGKGNRGDYVLGIRPDLVIGAGLSWNLKEGLKHLLQANTIFPFVPSEMASAIGLVGYMRDYPMATWPPKRWYPRPHYLPSVLVTKEAARRELEALIVEDEMAQGELGHFFENELQ